MYKSYKPVSWQILPYKNLFIILVFLKGLKNALYRIIEYAFNSKKKIFKNYFDAVEKTLLARTEKY